MSSNINPFVEPNMSEISLNIDSMLAVVEDHLHRAVGGDDAPTDAPYLQGLVIAIESSRAHAKKLYETLEGHPWEYWEILTENQKDTLGWLIRNVAEGDVNSNQVACKESARIALARFEAETDNLTAEECANELLRLDAGVTLNLTPETDEAAGYFVTREWTLKGLRHDLAHERFIGSVMCNCDQDNWREAKPRTEVEKSSQSPTDATTEG